MKVLFWGSPEFALPSLRALMREGHSVVGVVTQPDRPAGRGRGTKAPPVKVAAEEAGIDVLQPERPRGSGFLGQIRKLGPELSIVAAYGKILPREVLSLPLRGSINVHASLLPELRGAAPVNWAIINGCRRTGVTIMKMVEELDAGPIILQESCAISMDEAAGQLADRLADLGAAALLEALTLIEAGEAVERPQDDAAATYAPKLGPDDVRLDWTKPAEQLERWIRGADPAPAAWSEVDCLRVRLFAPQFRESSVPVEPGVVVKADPKDGLVVGTGAGTLRIGEVQPAGKRRMQAAEWIRGRGISKGQRFR